MLPNRRFRTSNVTEVAYTVAHSIMLFPLYMSCIMCVLTACMDLQVTTMWMIGDVAICFSQVSPQHPIDQHWSCFFPHVTPIKLALLISAYSFQLMTESQHVWQEATLLSVAMAVMVETTTVTMPTEETTTAATEVAMAALPQATMATEAEEAMLLVVSLCTAHVH